MASGLYHTYICCLVSSENPTKPKQNRNSLSYVKCTNSAVPEDTLDHGFWSNVCAEGSIQLCQDKWHWDWWRLRGFIYCGFIYQSVHFLRSLFVLTASQSKFCRNAALDSEWAWDIEAYFSLASHRSLKKILLKAL